MDTLNTEKKYGSDLIIEILNQHHIDYVACNPGATFRGLHDSIINYKKNNGVSLIMCCHEEISVAIAHGYAKASGKYMAVFVHANIGLQHASMAIFNAWCDRVPMLIIGGVGPLDTTLRRPWIDWIHTSNNHDNIIRDYVKWCDQPYNLASTPESLYRACKITNTEPQAPVYIALDATIQEGEYTDEISLADINKYSPPLPSAANEKSLKTTAELLLQAKFPLIIVDHMGRHPLALQKLIDLSNLLSIPVIDLGGRYNFPNNNPFCLTGMETDIYNKVDFILALDVHDLYGALGELQAGEYKSYINDNTKIVHVTLSDYLISRWSADYHKLYPVNFTIAANSTLVLKQLFDYCKNKISRDLKLYYQQRKQEVRKTHTILRKKWRKSALKSRNEQPLALPVVLYTIWQAIQKEDWMLTNNAGVDIGKWIKKLWTFSTPGCYLGESGGAGLGYGLGASIGAALAYKNANKLCIDMQADGDFLFTPSALWTAAHYEVPLLIIVMNNRSYNNSKEHAAKIAKHRSRKTDNANIGTCFENPPVNFPMLAQAFGIFSQTSVTDLDEIIPAIEKAINFIKRNKKPALVDIIIQ